MLVGENRVGKSALIKALAELCPEFAESHPYVPHRAMAVEYYGFFVNTPGEFLENRRFYRALITTAAECHTILMVQDSTRKSSLFPPGFAMSFNRKIIGVITGMDKPESSLKRAERFLKQAGVRNVMPVSADGKGLQELATELSECR